MLTNDVGGRDVGDYKVVECLIERWLPHGGSETSSQ
jgi:hypothetical protein